MAVKELSPLQERFCQEYLTDLNASAAYQRAGYKAKGNAAEVNAARLLRNAQVQARIATLQAARSERTQITADRVLQELALIAFSDVGQILDFSQSTPHLRPCQDIPESARRALASVKVRRYTEGHGDDATEVEVTEFKLWSKDSALEKLAKHLGLYKDTTEHKHSGHVGLTLSQGGELARAAATNPDAADAILDRLAKGGD